MAQSMSSTALPQCVTGIALNRHERQEEKVADKPTESSSEVSNPENQVQLLSKLLDMNKSLQSQTEILRLRIQFDSKKFEKDKIDIVSESENQLQEKEVEIKDLQDKVKVKESRVDNLTTENESKTEKIQELETKITELQQEINTAREYTKTLQEEYAALQEIRGTTAEREKLVGSLRMEIEHMQRNLSAFERQLEQARIIIRKQHAKITSLTDDRKRIEIKFKEELNKTAISFRTEFGKLRDVMKGQNDEMRALREQNESMSRDIKDIKQMLIDSQVEAEKAPQVQTDRHPRNRLTTNVNTFTNVLPTLKKDSKRIIAGKRK